MLRHECGLQRLFFSGQDETRQDRAGQGKVGLGKQGRHGGCDRARRGREAGEPGDKEVASGRCTVQGCFLMMLLLLDAVIRQRMIH